jgi:hypothetical protein
MGSMPPPFFRRLNSRNPATKILAMPVALRSRSICRNRSPSSPPDQNRCSKPSASLRAFFSTLARSMIMVQEMSDASIREAITSCTRGLAFSTRWKKERSLDIRDLHH